MTKAAEFASKATENEHEERPDVEEEEDEEEQAVEADKSKAEEASAMNKMNADDDEKAENEMDVNTMRKLLASLKAQEEQDKEAHTKREKELASIKINKDDVVLLTTEFLLTPAQAERKLRLANGNLKDCIKSALRLP